MPTNSGSNRNTNQGTGFVDYGKILNANQGSGERMGQAIAGGLESQANAVQGQLGQQQNEFNQGLDTAQQNWQNVSTPAQDLATKGTSQDWENIGTNYANQDLTNVGNNFRNFGYTGPTGLKNSTGLQSQAATASALGQMAGNTQGQQGLLRNYVAGGQGNYTQGQNAFDQALLSKYGQTPINQAKQGLTGINTQVNNAVTGSENLANQQKQLISSQQKTIGDQITKSLGQSGAYTPGQGSALGTNVGGSGLLGQATTQAGQFEQGANQIQQILSQAINNPTQLQADIASGKIDPSVLNNLSQYGLDPNKQLYQKNNSNYNQAQLANLLGLYGSTGLANIPKGGQQFTGNQKAAATALAQFLGDPRVSQIQGNNFDNNVFDPSTHNNATLFNQYNDVVKAGGSEQGIDTQAQNDVRNYNTKANEIKNLYSNGSGIFDLNGLRPQAANNYINSPNDQTSEYLNHSIADHLNTLQQGGAGSPYYYAISGQSPFVNSQDIAGQNISLQELLKNYINNTTNSGPIGSTGHGPQIIPH